MNKVILKGNLTRDPESRTIPSGSTVANFTVAVSRYYKKKNGEKDQSTEYIDCEAWDSGAETIVQILSKGDPVLIEGSIKNDNWEDKETGQKRTRTKIRVERFEKLYRRSVVETDEAVETNDEPVGVSAGEDIPF